MIPILSQIKSTNKNPGKKHIPHGKRVNGGIRQLHGCPASAAEVWFGPVFKQLLRTQNRTQVRFGHMGRTSDRTTVNGSEGSGSSSEPVRTGELDVYIRKNHYFFYLITRLIDGDGRMSARDSEVCLSSSRNMTLAISTFQELKGSKCLR